jgi:hypothetical protein
MMGVFERAMIQERVKSGLERARAQGKRLGRRPIDARKEAAIRADLREGKAGIMKLAAAHGVGKSRSGSQRLGVRLEAILNHVSGSRGGVVGVYQLQSWDAEKRATLAAWAAHVVSLGESESHMGHEPKGRALSPSDR